MTEPAHSPEESRQRHVRTFEDPHYHDEDDIPPPADDAEVHAPAGSRRPLAGKPSRRIPPPPRRFSED
ncbi:MAG TPA: hypothetical protein VMS17_23965 [Gemmataceae bacterium]|nr:hypothetical protein [Gemmataceae bacterium]